MSIDPVKAVEQVKDKVMETGKSWFSGLLSSPIDFIKGGIGTALGTVTGTVKGVFNGIFGNLYRKLLTAGGIFAATQIVPDLVAWVPLPINGKKIGHIMAEHAQEGGAVAIAKDSIIAAVAIDAAIGAVKGGANAMADGQGTKDTPVAEKIGSGATSLAIVAGLGMLAFSQVKSNNIAVAGSADQSTKTPGATPAVNGASSNGPTV